MTSTDESIRIGTVRSPKAMRAFVDLGFELGKFDPGWVPPPRRDIERLLDRKRHPFHAHARVEYFLAVKDGRPAGRIAALENFAHNVFHDEKVGFFGFLDAEPGQELFDALLGKAEAWARARGLTHLRGPCSFSTNEECGLLVEGHHYQAAVMMPHQPKYYQRMIEAAGYEKAKDLISYHVEKWGFDERVWRLADMIRQRLDRQGAPLRFRSLDVKNFESELDLVLKVYNKAWEKNWGFVPMTEAEVRDLAYHLKPVIDPELVRIALVGDEPVGFAFGLPDYNRIAALFQGKFGWREALVFFLTRNRLRHGRLLTLGVVEDYRNRGIETVLIADWAQSCVDRGIIQAELGWILEDNEMMNKVLLSIGSEPYKRYRIYEKRLSAPASSSSS